MDILMDSILGPIESVFLRVASLVSNKLWDNGISDFPVFSSLWDVLSSPKSHAFSWSLEWFFSHVEDIIDLAQSEDSYRLFKDWPTPQGWSSVFAVPSSKDWPNRQGIQFSQGTSLLCAHRRKYDTSLSPRRRRHYFRSQSLSITYWNSHAHSTPDISYAVSALSLYFLKHAGCTRLWPVVLSTTSRQFEIMFLFWARGKEADGNYIVASRLRQGFRPLPGQSKVSNGSFFPKLPICLKILKDKPDGHEYDRGWVLCFHEGNHGDRVAPGRFIISLPKCWQRFPKTGL